MPELFSGDYSFVQSEYHKACAVGRSEHQGGGFIGKLNQDTEMIMCCNENMHDGLSIPIVMEGVGTFTEYGRFDDPAPRGIGSNYERTENAHVGAVRCDYPSAYPTWTPALKAKNLEECANECSSLDDCGGFNIVSGEQERAREGERDWGLQSTNDDCTSPVSETGHTIWCGKDTVAVVEVPVAVVVDSVVEVAVTVVETI